MKLWDTTDAKKRSAWASSPEQKLEVQNKQPSYSQ